MEKETLHQRVQRIERENRNLGAFIILSTATAGQKFNRWKLYKMFNEFVPKSDYLLSEREDLLMFLEKRNNTELSSRAVA